MLRYYWVTTRDCVPPDTILSAMQSAGFRDVERTISLGIFSEYSGQKSEGRSQKAEGI